MTRSAMPSKSICTRNDDVNIHAGGEVGKAGRLAVDE